MDPLTQLPAPDAFSPTGLRTDLQGQIKELADEVNAARDVTGGLSRETVEQIERELLINRIHESNAIEGNSLDRRETITVIATGEIVSGKKRDSDEVINMLAAVEEAQALTRNDYLRETDIRGLHSILLRGLIPDAGRYRRGSVAIAGAKFQPPEADAIPPLMKELVEKIDQYRRSSEALTLACFGHWSLARIHPFTDGNGRMSRLLQDMLLMQHRYVPVVIPAVKSNDYYASLQSADEGDTQDFVELIAQELLASLARYKAAIDRTVGRTEYVKSLAERVTAKRRNSRHAKYLRWKSSMESLAAHFSAICNELNESIDGVSIRRKDYEVLDFEQYEQICTTGKAARTWHFSLDFKIDDQRRRYVFWYGSHHRRPADTMTVDREPVMLVSVEEEDHGYRILADTDEHHISFREVAVKDGRLVMVRYDPVEDEVTFDTTIEPLDIAKMFFSEVFAKFGF